VKKFLKLTFFSAFVQWEKVIQWNPVFSPEPSFMEAGVLQAQALQPFHP